MTVLMNYAEKIHTPPGFGMVENVESSVYQWWSVVFETRQTLVVLDRCSDVGPVDLSERVLLWRLDGREGSLQLVKLQKCTAQENTHTSNRCLFWKFLSGSLLPHFSWVIVDMALCWCHRSPCKFSGFTWFAIVFVHRPLPKHWKSTKLWRKSTCGTILLVMKEQRPGAWHGGLWLQGLKWWNTMEWRGVAFIVW